MYCAQRCLVDRTSHLEEQFLSCSYGEEAQYLDVCGTVTSSTISNQELSLFPRARREEAAAN
jgi:hypothetical protein